MAIFDFSTKSLSNDLARASFSRRGFLSALGLVGVAGAAAIAGCSNNDADADAAVNEAVGSAASATDAAAAGSADEGSSAAADDASAAGGIGSNVLVAYYSAQGHTQAVAQAAADALGADLFAITPVEPYADEDLNYSDSESRVSREHDDESLRDVALEQVTPNGFDAYDTVLIGYPIWWGIAAWPVNGFVSGNDFTGKTVVPFCTSASSGLGQSGQLLEELAGTGTWLDGQRFASSVPTADVEEWAQAL